MDGGSVPTDRRPFIIPSTIAAKYATQAGISSATTGRFMELWTRAMSDYNATASCHWTNAATDLTTLKTQYPNFGGVAPYLTQAKQSAAAETCATSSATPGVVGDVTAGLLVIGGSVVAVVALFLGLIFLAVSMTRRKQRRVPVAAGQYVASAPPRYTPQAPPAALPPNPQLTHSRTRPWPLGRVSAPMVIWSWSPTRRSARTAGRRWRASGLRRDEQACSGVILKCTGSTVSEGETA